MFAAGFLTCLLHNNVSRIYTAVSNFTDSNKISTTANIIWNVISISIEQVLSRRVIHNKDGTYKLQFVIAGKLHEFGVYPETGPHALLKSPAERGSISLARYQFLRR